MEPLSTFLFRGESRGRGAIIDAASAWILQTVAEAAGPGTTLLIVDRVVADHTPAASVVMSDLNMMVNTGGAERTVSEWRAPRAGGRAR